MSILRRHINFIGVACKVRHEGNRRFILSDDAAPIGAFSCDDILKKNASRRSQMFLTGLHLRLNSLENEVGRINLAVWMRIRYPNGLASILKNQNMVDLGMTPQFLVLLLPHSQQTLNLGQLQLS